MFKSFLLSILSLILSLNLLAQTPISGDIQARIGGIIDNLPPAGGEDFSVPTTIEQDNWKVMIGHILNGQFATAAGEASAMGYELFAFTDNTVPGNRLYYLLEEAGPQTRYWGTFVFNPNACRADLVLQAPHVKHDYNTGKEAIYIFHEIEARAFLMSGTHRCNVTATSSCTGTSKVCSSTNTSEPYRKSDMSHVVESMFQATTKQIMTDVASSKFIQLHGFTKKSTDPYLIMSNGTDQTPTVDYMPALRDNLLAEDNVLTFKIPHIDIGWTRLVGFWNTQGRMINGENTPCTSGASTTNGHFFHIEQEKNRLRLNQSGWTKMSNALANTFPCQALAIENSTFYASVNTDKSITLKWTIGIEKEWQHYDLERSADGLSFHRIGHILNKDKPFYFFVDKHPLSGNNFYRLKMVSKEGVTAYSSIILAELDNDKDNWQLYPNPAYATVTLKMKAWQSKKVQVYDALGQPISAFIPLNGQLTTIDLTTFPKSTTFWLVLFDNSGRYFGSKQVFRAD